MFGYHGRVLVINLSTKTSRWDLLPQKILQKYLGGTGLGAYLLYQYCPPGADPLGEYNPLILVTSPLVGSKITTTSKFAIVTKSPLTGFIGDSISSSYLATELKAAGCDALIITGRSSKPIYIYIDNGDIQFLDAKHLLGNTTIDTERAIKDSFGAKVRVACIGPAGENGVLFASIANDGGRLAGRTGTGAVMGSKNLKAIAVKGSQTVPAYDQAALLPTRNDLSRRSLGPATEKYRGLGTIANMSVFNRLAVLPTYNFQRSTFDQAESISGETIQRDHFTKSSHCANCTIGCEKIVTTTDSNNSSTARMEYESAFALGPLLGISDPNVVIRATKYCDETGMDTISTGVTIAWAMECFERGLLTLSDTHGIDLRFGNSEAIHATLESISQRQGLGDLLAQGSRKASSRLGQGSDEWAMHVKGLEMPGYEPRSLKTMALGLAVSTRGACHNRSSSYEADFSPAVDRFKADADRGAITMHGEDYSAVMDSMIWCKFLRKVFDNFYEESAAIYEHITGWATTSADLKVTGERINNIKKLFNIREGWTRKDDCLPPRVLKEPLPTGLAQGIGLSANDLDLMIDSYYKARGWTSEGLINESKLLELEIEVSAPMQSPSTSLPSVKSMRV